MHAQAQPERPKGEGSSWSGAAPRLRGGRPSLRGGRPEAKHCFAKRERADTDVGPGGCKWIIIAAGRQRQQRSEVAGATLQMARVLFASNEGQMVERYRIFAFTTFYRADSMASPLRISDKCLTLPGCLSNASVIVSTNRKNINGLIVISIDEAVLGRNSSRPESRQLVFQGLRFPGTDGGILGAQHVGE